MSREAIEDQSLEAIEEYLQEKLGIATRQLRTRTARVIEFGMPPAYVGFTDSFFTTIVNGGAALTKEEVGTIFAQGDVLAKVAAVASDEMVDVTNRSGDTYVRPLRD